MNPKWTPLLAGQHPERALERVEWQPMDADPMAAQIRDALPRVRQDRFRPTAGGQYGGAQQTGRANSLQSAPGAARRAVGGSAHPDAPSLLLGNRHDAKPGAGA